jgi:hypothetical protein
MLLGLTMIQIDPATDLDKLFQTAPRRDQPVALKQ